MYRDDSGILSLVITCNFFGITNTSVQNFAIRISLLKLFFNKFNKDVSSLLMSSLRAIVIFQNYFGNHVISSKIHLFAPLLNMRRCSLSLLPLYIYGFEENSLSMGRTLQQVTIIWAFGIAEAYQRRTRLSDWHGGSWCQY